MQIWLMNITSDMQGIVGQALGKHVACSRKGDDSECVHIFFRISSWLSVLCMASGLGIGLG